MSELETVIVEYQNFPAQFESAVVATANSEGIPHASYAPFVMDADKNFYIFVSELANHASNLKATGKTSFLLIEDEAKSKNIFGRKRLTFECSATQIERATQEWNRIADMLQERFGSIVETLRNLGDFQIFKITPQEGLFVIGFGGAYKISGDDLNNLIPVRPKENKTK